MAMTRARQIFADEYIKDLNGTRAYKVAYPNVKRDQVAATAAGRLLRIVEVKAYIDGQLEKMHNERSADAQEIMEYLTSVMRGEQKEKTLISMGELGQDITDIDVGAKDRLKAAELLGKRYSLFTDKVDLNMTGELNIEIGDWDADENKED